MCIKSFFTPDLAVFEKKFLFILNFRYDILFELCKDNIRIIYDNINDNYNNRRLQYLFVGFMLFRIRNYHCGESNPLKQQQQLGKW